VVNQSGVLRGRHDCADFFCFLKRSKVNSKRSFFFFFHFHSLQVCFALVPIMY
jgi:hypothetical protein